MTLKTGILNVNDLDQDYNVVIQLKQQPQNVIHCVTLRPSRIVRTNIKCQCGAVNEKAMIRLGDSPGDEAVGWQLTENIFILAILGIAEVTTSATNVKPIRDLG